MEAMVPVVVGKGPLPFYVSRILKRSLNKNKGFLVRTPYS
jgi:hypothetical protein